MMLTKRQKQILDYIKKYIKENDYPPSLEEIGGHFNLSSPATIHQHIEALKTKGYLKNEPRTIQISENKKSHDLIEIPLAGVIAAGQPFETYEDNEIITVPKSSIGPGEHFALKVQGDSMIGRGIFDGDTVIIRKQNTADNGDIVVALINDNEVTLKTIYKEKKGFKLQPANLKMKPIFTKKITIQGKFIRVIRSFEELKKISLENKEFTEATIKYMEETNINHRKSFGQYFTPRSIIKILLSKLPNGKAGVKILDPACGTGEFLIMAKEYFKNSKLYGWDIDKNLINISQKTIPIATLKNIDALLNKDYGKYDFVIGNPPYYEFFLSDELRKKFVNVINGRANIFSLFIYQGLKWLKNGGYLAFVVPPSMNNGAYFSKLRQFIIENSNIEYLHILDDPKIFKGALQSTMLLVLKKGKNKGDYLFKKNGILIFSENAEYLKTVFKNKTTLRDMGFIVKTGRLVWNDNKHLLTNDSKKGVPLIWAHNITAEGLKFSPGDQKKPQYVAKKDFDIGPAIVVNRITGSVKSGNLRAAIIPANKKFIAENHVNVIFPPINQPQNRLNLNTISQNIDIENLANQLSSKEKLKIIQSITGNTQISKTELENLFPVEV